MHRRTDDYYAFVFRGLLAEASLDKVGRRRTKQFSEEANRELAERLGLLLLDDDLVAGARKMAVVYTAICAFENSVRTFIATKLLEEIGEKWWEKNIPNRVKKEAESRKEQESNIRWHTPRGDALMNYTEFGHLIAIMQDNWALFKPHVISIDWARQIFQSLERSRNVIMHSGELAAQDVERVGINIRDWIAQVG